MQSKPAAAGGDLQFLYPSSVDQFQQGYIAGQQFNSNVNMSGYWHCSKGCTFVGYRLTSDGKSVEFGEPEASELIREAWISALTNSGNQSSCNCHHNLVSGASEYQQISSQPSQLGMPCETSFQCQTVAVIYPPISNLSENPIANLDQRGVEGEDTLLHIPLVCSMIWDSKFVGLMDKSPVQQGIYVLKLYMMNNLDDEIPEWCELFLTIHSLR